MKLKKKSYPTILTRNNNKEEFTRACGLNLKDLNENERKVTVSFSSEQPYERWFGTEILQHDNDSVDLQRLKEIGVSLYNHNRNYVIGRLENIRLENERCYADIIFDDDEESEKVYKKVKSGSLKGVSVGYRVDRWEDVSAGEKSSNGKFNGPASIATKWTPFEVSIVSIPADDSVGVGRQFENNQQKNISDIQPEKDKTMLKELCRQLGLDYDALIGRGMTDEQITQLIGDMAKKNESPASQEQEKPNVEAERQAAAKAEKERTLEISNMCRDFDVDPKEYIEKDCTVDNVRAAILEKMKAERAPIPAGVGNITITHDEADKVRNVASDGLLMRAGISLDKPADGANDFRSMSLKDLAIDYLLRNGVNNAHRLDPEEAFKRAVTPDSQFTSILSDTVNKSMAKAYTANPTTYRNWVGIGSNPDFKDATHYRISEAGELKRITQQGEFQFDQMQDTSVKKALVTYGRKFGFTRQAMINDDLGVLTKIPQAYVRAADRGVNKLVYAILGGNPKIYDGVELFHANHGNLAGAGAAISTNTIAAGRKAMRSQKNLRGKETLNIVPAHLIIPTDLEVTAAQLLRATAEPTASHTGIPNIYANSMEIIVEPELDAYSTTAWHMVADSALIDTIEVTYLNGQESPKLESRVGFDYLGIEWRIYNDLGVTCLDYKGFYKNPGA